MVHTLSFSSISRLSARFHVLHRELCNIISGDFNRSKHKTLLMAGTRRQSRARDTTSTHQSHHSVSLVASVVPETAITTTPKVIEIAESVDEGSPRPGNSSQSETQINRSILAFCKNCNSKIGEFYNSWHKATGSYYSPALLGSYRSLLRSTDQRKEASDKTELAGW